MDDDIVGDGKLDAKTVAEMNFGGFDSGKPESLVDFDGPARHKSV